MHGSDFIPQVNCTTLKSLIEPYDNNPPQINLYNPSVLGSQITLHDLQPATKYSCRLVGAMSLDVGREKLAVLSEVVTFSTLLGKFDLIVSNHSGFFEPFPRAGIDYTVAYIVRVMLVGILPLQILMFAQHSHHPCVNMDV
jgi:hypothetical protein